MPLLRLIIETAANEGIMVGQVKLRAIHRLIVSDHQGTVESSRSASPVTSLRNATWLGRRVKTAKNKKGGKRANAGKNGENEEINEEVLYRGKTRKRSAMHKRRPIQSRAAREKLKFLSEACAAERLPRIA